MGSVIWITDATWDPQWDEYAERWHQDLAAKTNVQLVDSLNHEVGNNGWVSVRAIYLKILWEELHARDLDFSDVDDLARFPGERRFGLLGKRLVYASPPVS
jgi:hypothetical protein